MNFTQFSLVIHRMLNLWSTFQSEEKQVLLQLALQTWKFKHLIRKTKYIYSNQSIVLKIYLKKIIMKNGSKV
jgi:hypothetical protein